MAVLKGWLQEHNTDGHLMRWRMPRKSSQGQMDLLVSVLEYINNAK